MEKVCDHVFKKQVKIIVEIPFDRNDISKKAIRSKDVIIMGVDWNDAGKVYCERCGVVV